MIIETMEQLKPEWFAARCGIPSASRFNEIVTSTGNPSKQAKNYMFTLAGERIIGMKSEGYQSPAMKRGTELEPEARALYEFTQNVQVVQVGIVYKDGRKRYSCSPDGLVGEDGGLEIKCPNLSTHVEYLLDGKMPTTYICQVQGSLMITGRKWWDFLSYYPGMDPFLIRVERDEKLISAMGEQLELFCDELDKTVEKLRK